jgi:hypothetical protein
MDLSLIPMTHDKFADRWVETDIYNFPIIYEGTERWIRDEYPNFPEEFYPILAMRNAGMSWQTYKKLLRQEKKIQEKIERKKKKQIPFTIRTGVSTTIKF